MKRWLRDFFVPHEGNGYHPNSLEKRAATIMLLLVISTFSLGSLHSLATISSEWFISAILPGVLIDLTNVERSDETLGALKESAVLDRAAQLKADDMAKKGYFSHDTPEGLTPWYWFQKVDYDYIYAGENLAVHFTDSEDVVRAWMKSPGHRANIMKSEYTEIGIGTARGTYKGSPTVYVVQLFGTPRSDTTPVSIPAPARTVSQVPVPTVASASTTALTEEEQEAAPDVARVLSREADSMPDSVVQTPNVPSTTDATDTPLVSTSTDIAQNIDVPLEEAPAVEESVKDPYPSVLVSDMATTSAPIGSVTVTPTHGTPSPVSATARALELFNRLIASPQTVVGLLYLLLASFVLLSLVSALIFEWRRHNPVHMAYSAGLMVAMFILFYMHITLTGGALIV